VCPITGYTLKTSNGEDAFNDAKISLSEVLVSGIKQPTLTIEKSTVFTAAFRIVATNKGGATNYITVNIVTACTVDSPILLSSGQTFTLGPLDLSNTPRVDNTLAGKLLASTPACAITGFTMQTAAGDPRANDARIALSIVDGREGIEPRLTITLSSTFTETIRVVATHSGGATNYVSYFITVVKDCVPEYGVSLVGSVNTFTEGPLRIGAAALTFKTLFNKFVSFDADCPIFEYSI